MKGRIEVNSRQSWDGDEMVFMPLVSDLINIKVLLNSRYLCASKNDHCPGDEGTKVESAQTSHLIFQINNRKHLFSWVISR